MATLAVWWVGAKIKRKSFWVVVVGNSKRSSNICSNGSNMKAGERKAPSVKTTDDCLFFVQKTSSGQGCDLSCLVDLTWVDYIVLISSYGSCLPSPGHEGSVYFSDTLFRSSKQNVFLDLDIWTSGLFFKWCTERIQWTTRLQERQVLEHSQV